MWENDKFSMREDKEIEKITFFNTIIPRIKDRHKIAYEQAQKAIEKYGPITNEEKIQKFEKIFAEKIKKEEYMKNVEKIINWINFIAGAVGVLAKVIAEIVDLLPEEEKNETESK